MKISHSVLKEGDSETWLANYHWLRKKYNVIGSGLDPGGAIILVRIWDKCRKMGNK